MKTRITVMAVALLAVPLAVACVPPPPPPPTFAPLSSYQIGVYPVSTDPTEQFRIEPGLYMSEPDLLTDDVNREDAFGNILGPPVADRVLMLVGSTDLSVQVSRGVLVRWAARVPNVTFNTYLDGQYLTRTELPPGTYNLTGGGTDGVREWARLKAYNADSDLDVLDSDFSDDGSPITPLVIDDSTPSSLVPVVYVHGFVSI